MGDDRVEADVKAKILLVSDNLSSVEVLTAILEPTYPVVLAANGEEGVKTAEEVLPDLILLDVKLPDNKGFEVLTILKESDLTRGITVIMITEETNIADEECALALGAVDYMAKPFNQAIVRARVLNQMQTQAYIRTIERMGMIDALTDIPNRRSFDAQLKKEWERAIRERTCIGILMMDLDDFKQYNDTYGHTQGDVLLRTISRVLEQSLKRPADFVARWGGEEFVILLPNTDAEGTVAVAEQVREHVAREVIPHSDGTATHITISIGVNALMPQRYDSTFGSQMAMEEFVCGADVALYEAKHAGKNRVRQFLGDSSDFQRIRENLL